ncbi:hypothetical protein BJ508DRAFT_315260 [Ascobolus immersus RN42]|uniref:Uncharacterized protein n=1 Tax=Ascobolus immersus RN42 TaxID=1160509 RepID=A0A3N4HG61_ASCIM|nr:hypothetical protein BJ508DRAFT_315260 [Ascobolus immersus RN42]
MLPFPEEELYEMPSQLNRSDSSPPTQAGATTTDTGAVGDSVPSVTVVGLEEARGNGHNYTVTGREQTTDRPPVALGNIADSTNLPAYAGPDDHPIPQAVGCGQDGFDYGATQTIQVDANIRSNDGGYINDTGSSSPGPVSPGASNGGDDHDIGNTTEYLNPSAELAIVLSQYNHDADQIAELLCTECGIHRSLHAGTIRAIHVGSDNSPAMYDQSYPKLNEKVIFMPGIASNGTLGMVIVPFDLSPVVGRHGNMVVAPYGWARIGVDNHSIRDLILVGHTVTGRITWVSDCFYWKRLFCNYHFEVEWEVSEPINSRTITVLGLARISEYLDSWVNNHSYDSEDSDDSIHSSEKEYETSPLVEVRPPGLIISTPRHARQHLPETSPASRFLTDIGLTFSSAIGTIHSEMPDIGEADGRETIPSSPPKPLGRRLFVDNPNVSTYQRDEESQPEVPDSQPPVLGNIDQNIQATLAIAPPSIFSSPAIGTNLKRKFGGAAANGMNVGQQGMPDESNSPAHSVPSAFANASVSAQFLEDGDLEIRFNRELVAKRRKEN